jgi:uncharacterized protein YqfA (UPF0365 family)
MDKIPPIVFVIIFLFVFLAMFGKVFIAWYKSRTKYYPLSLGDLFGMHFRKQDLNKMIEIHETIKTNNLELTLKQAEMFILKNGRVDDLLQEAHNCKRDNKNFNFEQYADIYFSK